MAVSENHKLINRKSLSKRSKWNEYGEGKIKTQMGVTSLPRETRDHVFLPERRFKSVRMTVAEEAASERSWMRPAAMPSPHARGANLYYDNVSENLSTIFLPNFCVWNILVGLCYSLCAILV